MIKLVYPEGSTPLNPDESTALIPAHMTTQAELNEWEQANILDAEQWSGRKKRQTAEILDMQFLKQLHDKMFDQTWRWAGQFRKSDKNIGVHWREIATSLKKLFDDVNFQLAYKTYSLDEMAARFHHRLTSIHPFVNGNGRHARLMTDLLLISLGRPRFTWGSKNLVKSGETRKLYMTALLAADKQNYKLLLAFVRS